jgi:transcriptional regulator with XRE-family HTH domain
MPYTDPDEIDHKIAIRFPGDPYLQPVRHNSFERRESPVGEILGDVGMYPPPPVSDIEALMAEPCSCPVTLAEVEGYGDVVDTAYTAAATKLTQAQRDAWDLERAGLTQRAMAQRTGITRNAVFERLRGARRKLVTAMEWVIDPVLRRKYHEPKPPVVKPKTVEQIAVVQQIGALLARSDYDDSARWRVARLLDHALTLGLSLTDLSRRTGMVPTVLAQLVADFRNG